MKSVTLFLLGSVALSGGAGAVLGQSRLPDHLVRPAAGSVRIDGSLEERAWAEAVWIPLRFEWFPGENASPPVQGGCFVTFDDRSLLVGCRAEDPAPHLVRARLSDRDDIEHDDRFVLWIDASGDRRTAFRFAVNPVGVQADALVLQGDVDEGWDTIWDSAARSDDRGWTAEIAIPFGSLRFPEGARRWGLVIERVWPRGSLHRLGNVPFPRDETCLLCRAARVTGLEGVESGHAIEIDPSVAAIGTERPRSVDEDRDFELDAGLSGRWDATRGTRVSVTVNPDFNQVEADADQLDVNTRFALRFPEKRPFFLDGADFFDTFGNLDLAFTRTVADPVAGAQVTGRVEGHAYGALVTRDARNNVLLPGSQESDVVTLGGDVTAATLRYRRDLGESSSMGAIGTMRSSSGYRNQVGGIDGFLRIGSRQRIRYLLAASRTDYPVSLADRVERVGRPFSGGAAFARYDFEGRHWGVELSYRETGADFRADAGFVPRIDTRGPEIQVRRTLWGDDARWFDRIDLAVEAQDLRNTEGKILDRKLGWQIGYAGPGQSELAVEAFRRENRFEGRLFDLVGIGASVAARPTVPLELAATIEVGEEIDTDHARLGDQIDLGLSAGLRPGRSLRLDGTYRWQRLDVNDGRVFSAHLPQGRIEYHFARGVFVRGIVQYRHVRRDPERFADPVEPESRRAFLQTLFAWRPDARTVLFMGYSDEAEDDRADMGFQRTDRSIFVKVAYAWRL